jgi:prophage DNA circulation protein
MSWRDELRPAAFRGVPFEIVELGGSSGRRVVADELPETDELPPTQDLGRVRPEYKIRGFVSGLDYLDKRDAIIAALNAPGPGELVHPWRGRMVVQVRAPVTWTHDSKGGACVIDFECVLHGGAAAPFVEVVPVVQAQAAATAATARAVAVYGARGAGSSTLTEALQFRTLVRFPGGQLLTPSAWGVDFAEAFAELLQLTDDIRGLLAYVASLAATTRAGSSALGEADAEARQAINDGMRLIALVRAVELTLAAPYASADAAESVASATATLLADWQAGITDEALFLSLGELQAGVVDTLTDVAARLPRERELHVSVPTPAIVLAFDTYGPLRLLAREAELVALNGIGHPGFVAGRLKVLSR